MWFTRKKEKGKETPSRPGQHGQAREERSYEPPAGPPPGYRGVNSRDDGYAPPSGPPPGRASSQNDYAPPTGPPPHRMPSQDYQYAPPLGPPPGRAPSQNDYLPPDGPPPSWTQPPPASAAPHDWQTAVPDTSLFPPPPALFSTFDASPANNATAAEADAGEAWCAQYPLCPPIAFAPPARRALGLHDIAPVPPAGFAGRVDRAGPGRWAVRTSRGSRDACVLGYPPLYSVLEHAGAPRTIYYEVRVGKSRGGGVNIALGFAALPYPSFRLPGWHRGSLAVHGDDGHRYVNDCWGGRAFTAPFVAGGVYGVGMVLRPGGGGRVFFTRDGRMEGGWDVHEETDAERDMGVFGLEGRHDLSCAIGCFEDVDMEVVFDPRGWKYVLE